MKSPHRGGGVSDSPRLAFHMLGGGYAEEFWSDVLQKDSLREKVKIVFSESSSFSATIPQADFYPHESGPNQFITESISNEAISALRYPDSQSNQETYWKEILDGLKKLLDRRDFSGSFRNVDRDAFIRLRLLEYVHILHAEEIEGVICSTLPHNFESMCLYHAATILGIPFLTFEKCGIADVVFPVTAVGIPGRMLYESATRSQETKNMLKAQSVIENLLVQELRNRSYGSAPPSYIEAQRKEKSKNRAPIGIVWRAQNRLLRLLLSTTSSDAKLSASYSFPQHRWLNLKTKLALSFFSEILTRLGLEKASKKANHKVKGEKIYYLFALGFEPESTTFPEGKPYYSQFDALLDVRAVVPKDEILWVREHPSQHFRSMQGHLGISTIFIEAVNQLEKTKFLSGDLGTEEIFGSAKAIFTLTGTIAVEAALRQIKVFSLGSPWWDGMPGTQKFDFDRSKIGNSANSMEASQEEICSFLIKRVSKLGVASPFRGTFGSTNEDKSSVLYKAGVEGTSVAIKDWLVLNRST